MRLGQLYPALLMLLVGLHSAPNVGCDCLTSSLKSRLDLLGGEECILEACAAVEAGSKAAGTTSVNCYYEVVNTSRQDSHAAAELQDASWAGFELTLSVDAAEVAVVGLIEFNRRHQSGRCVKFAICPGIEIDGQQRRLKVSLKLEATQYSSYALYETKTSGGRLCSQPQMTLFLPQQELNGKTWPAMQLVVKNSSCVGANAGCTIDAYLLRMYTKEPTLLELIFSRKTQLWFTRSEPGWQRKTVHGVALTYSNPLSTYKIDKDKYDGIPAWKLQAHSLLSVDKLATLAVSCAISPLGPSGLSTPITAAMATAEQRSAQVFAAVTATVAAAALFLALLLMWLLLLALGSAAGVGSSCCNPWHRRQRRRAIILLFPSGAAADTVRCHPAVARFRRALATAPVVKRGRLSLWEVPDGLAGLTPVLVRTCGALALVCEDASFAEFRREGCRSPVAWDALATVLAEKQRTRGFYLRAEPPPPRGHPCPMVADGRPAFVEDLCADATAAESAAKRFLADVCSSEDDAI